MSDTRVAVRPYVIAPSYTSFVVPAATPGTPNVLFLGSTNDASVSSNVSLAVTVDSSAQTLVVLVGGTEPGTNVVANGHVMNMDVTNLSTVVAIRNTSIWSLPMSTVGTLTPTVTATLQSFSFKAIFVYETINAPLVINSTTYDGSSPYNMNVNVPVAGQLIFGVTATNPNTTTLLTSFGTEPATDGPHLETSFCWGWAIKTSSAATPFTVGINYTFGPGSNQCCAVYG